jgi:hypothetical protein
MEKMKRITTRRGKTINKEDGGGEAVLASWWVKRTSWCRHESVL